MTHFGFKESACVDEDPPVRRFPPKPHNLLRNSVCLSLSVCVFPSQMFFGIGSCPELKSAHLYCSSAGFAGEGA